LRWKGFMEAERKTIAKRIVATEIHLFRPSLDLMNPGYAPGHVLKWPHCDCYRTVSFGGISHTKTLELVFDLQLGEVQ